jgi:hypothetical protein
MKRKFWLGLFVLLLFQHFVAAQVDTAFYDHKIASFNHLKNGGFMMTCVGSGLALVGTVLLIDLPSGYWSQDYTSSGTTEDDIGDVFEAVFGVIAVGLGVGLMAGGLTMAGIGARKASFYQEKRNSLKVGLILTPNRQGLTLTYRF